MGNYWAVMQKKEFYKKKVLEAQPDIKNDSGIYFFTREENGIKFCYLGQALHLIDRIVSHLSGYSQRIDVSLKKRGLFPNKEDGWHLTYIYCLPQDLDSLEKGYIKEYANKGYQLYNKSLGGQNGERETAIGDGESNKGYRDGLKQGYENCLKDIREYFEKYLRFDITFRKECRKKDGTYKEIYLKKYDEFEKLIKK